MKITDKNIAQFLQKYMDGQTSVDEERMLADYFRKHGGRPLLKALTARTGKCTVKCLPCLNPNCKPAASANDT